MLKVKSLPSCRRAAVFISLHSRGQVLFCFMKSGTAPQACQNLSADVISAFDLKSALPLAFPSSDR